MVTTDPNKATRGVALAESGIPAMSTRVNEARDMIVLLRIERAPRPWRV
jgi:hypothetical protein